METGCLASIAAYCHGSRRLWRSLCAARSFYPCLLPRGQRAYNVSMQILSSSTRHQLQLPEPSADALAASQALQNQIHAELARQGGIMSFARYMELSLYAPQLGYYSGGSQKLGRDGDFTTAPEMSALFGAALAHAAAPLLAQTVAQVMEFGAGTGRLAFDFLSECQQLGVTIERYFIVELSGELRARQESLLQSFSQVVWLTAMPQAFSGLVLGNEVLDAMPVQLMVKTEQGWRECGVALDAAADVDVSHKESAQLILREMPLHEQTAESLAACIPDADALPLDYLTETHEVATAFMRSVSAMLLAGQAETGRGGAAIWIDYGFPAREYYLAERAQGTLMCHYRHHAHPNPFFLPGLQDITAHVNFTAIAQAGVEMGLRCLCYTSQGAFLLAAGVGDLLLRIPNNEVMRYLPASNAVQKLISPAEMGELFKVLVIGCGLTMPENYLTFDRTHRL